MMRAKTRIMIELLTSFTVVIYNYLFIKDTPWMYITFVMMGFIVPFVFVSETATAAAAKEKIGIFKKTFLQQILFGILIGAVIAVGCHVLLHILYTFLPVHVSVSRMLWIGKSTAWIINIFIQGAAAAFFEELFFRNYLDNRFSKLISNDYIRVILIALIYAISQITDALPYLERYQNLGRYQSNVMTIVYIMKSCGIAFIFSLIMGLCRTKIKNFTLLSCVIGHYVVNLIGELVISINVLPA